MLVKIPDFRLRLVEEAEKVLEIAIDRAVKSQKPLTAPLPELRVAPDSAADGDDFSLPVVSDWGAGHSGTAPTGQGSSDSSPSTIRWIGPRVLPSVTCGVRSVCG